METIIIVFFLIKGALHINKIVNFGPNIPWVNRRILDFYDSNPSAYFTPEKVYRLIFIKEYLGLLISILIIFAVLLCW